MLSALNWLFGSTSLKKVKNTFKDAENQASQIHKLIGNVFLL